MNGMEAGAGTGLLVGVAPEHGPALAAALFWLLVIVGWRRAVRWRAERGSRRAMRRLEAYYRAGPLTRWSAAVLLLAGLIHLALVPGHWADERATAQLFLLNGLAFAGLAGGCFTRRHWRGVAAALLIATMLAYALYLLSGKEDPDQVGLATLLVELLGLGLVLAPRGRTAATWRWLGTAGAVAGLTLLTGATAWAVSFRPTPDGTPAETGMVMQPTPSTATPAQVAAAAWLVAATRAGIAPYADVRRALAAGYRPSTSPFAPTVHYLNPRFVADGRALDPRRPAALVYANTPQGPVLLGAMFMTAKPGQPGPDIGGPLTRWHVHTNLCFGGGAAIVGFVSPFGLCPAGSVNVVTPAMLHVWTVPNTNGPLGDLAPTALTTSARP